MKKFAISVLITAFFLATAGCHKDNPFEVTVTVTVVNLLSEPIKGVTVYLFKDEFTLHSKPANALLSVTSDKNGVANFDFDMRKFNIVERETLLYFAAFRTVAGQEFSFPSTPITVKQGDTKSFNLKVP